MKTYQSINEIKYTVLDKIIKKKEEIKLLQNILVHIDEGFTKKELEAMMDLHDIP